MSKKEDKKQPILALDPISYNMLKKQEQESIESSKEEKTEKNDQSVLGMILKSLQSQASQQVDRMAFEVDPLNHNTNTANFYKVKTNLTPDHVIKKLIGPSGDELVSQILQARANHISAFGRPRTDRFSTGFDFVDMDKNAIRSEEEQKAIQERIDKARSFLWKCGLEKLDNEADQPNLSQILKQIVRDGIAYGRLAVEHLYAADPKTGKKVYYGFRPVDAGTIYKILPKREQDQTLRAQAVSILAGLKNEKISVEKYKKDEYRYVQVIDGKPVQAFAEDELSLYTLYPVTNVEYNGYPLTPIDQALNAITTHINITMHNKLYFQNGRAAKGMLVFKSDSIDESTVQKIRLQFHQSINSVQNSWRMPVFAVGAEDDVAFSSIDTQGRDAEFQYLMDNNARVILSSFQMSPEELPGYAHLARGTNTQALSESDNEWKLTAARDVGLRPLVLDIQDFLNNHVLAKADPELAKTHQIVLAGLEKDSPEKEATRLQQDMPIHMTYNEVLEHVEKNLLDKSLGGDFPLNPQFQQIISQYLTVGQILEAFFGVKDASKDPRYQYIRDPFWFQKEQLILQKAQLAMQQQMMVEQQMQQQMMAQQQAAMGQDPQQEGQQPPEQGTDQQQNMQKNLEWSANNYAIMEKAIKSNHNTISRMLLERHKQMVDNHLSKWSEHSKEALKELEKVLKDKGE